MRDMRNSPLIRAATALLFCVSYTVVAAPDATLSPEVVVVGATPGGIATAISAARLGHSVTMIEYHRHVGGMSASGLGKSDVVTRGAIGGLFGEFVGRVREHYVGEYGADSDAVRLCRDGYFYEPSVAESIFRQMIAAERRIDLRLGHRLEEVVRKGRRVVAIRAIHRDSGATVELRAKVFVDATYEGDLAAYAGAAYRLGREPRGAFNEAHAGVIYMDHKTRKLLPGTTGLGDTRLPAYTFRLCLTTDPANQVGVEKPPGYDRSLYRGYFEDLRQGRIDSALLAFSIAPIPNQKTDVNMKPWPLGFPFAEENVGYVEADWDERERITARIRNITLGLFYFLQNDPELSERDREAARRYGFAKDEFIDNKHFPWQLYVREARRIVGLYTLTENDLVRAPESGRTPVHADAVCAGEFPIDSFPTRKWEPPRTDAMEGYILMLSDLTRPYQIPYRAMVPKDVDGLLVPVAASTTHVAFSSVRMEPTWMCLGQAAGIAAHFSIVEEKQPRNLRSETLQRELLRQGQVLTYFQDIEDCGEAWAAMQYLGTKGFFEDYHARPREPLTREVAVHWMALSLRLVGRGVRV
jgi:hypothetical protein